MDFSYKHTTPTIDYHHTLSHSPDPDRFERHCHTGYEILYVVSGRGKYVTEGREYPLSAGTLLFQRPYDFHYVLLDPNTPYERYVFHFDYNFFEWDQGFKKMLKTGAESGLGIYYTPEGTVESLSKAYLMLDSIDSVLVPAGADVSKIHLMLETVLIQVLLLLLESRAEDSVQSANKTVLSIIEYINENLTSDLSLDKIANEFYLSKYHLCRLFLKQTGVSLFAYVSAKRIALAQNLINAGELPSQVAYKVGYTDYSAFYRAYKKQTGRSPGK